MRGRIVWTDLQHCYGPADDIPPLLEAAANGPPPSDARSEPWHSLWSALCHQGDVFPASYAALPELVDIALRREDATRWQAFLLAACIELGRHDPTSPECPPVLLGPLLDAIARASRAIATWPIPVDPLDRRRREIAEAVFAGRLAEAHALLDV
jgi:hypothetical protein